MGLADEDEDIVVVVATLEGREVVVLDFDELVDNFVEEDEDFVEELDFEDELEDFELEEEVFVVEVTDLEVDVNEVEEGFTDPLLELVDATPLPLLLVLARDESIYISSLFPAPQYSYWLPGQVNEQSERVVLTDPAFGDVPQ